MIITKVIEVGIDIKDCINLYSDPDNLRQIIEYKYLNRCFRGCYITSITRIIKTGVCVINKDGNPTFGTIPVIFEVAAICYMPGEIVTNCLVISNKTTGILCTTAYSSIMIAPHALLSSITKGNIITICVGQAVYKIGLDKISINAVLYTPRVSNDIFFMKHEEINESILEDVKSRIQQEEAAAVLLRKNTAWDMFDKLIYAFVDDKADLVTNKVNILELQPQDMYISRDPRIRMTTPFAAVFDKPNENTPYHTNMTAENVVLLLHEDYYAHLKLVRELVEIYSTPELIRAHNHLWLIYKKMKLRE
jgi:hypothetical protein